MFNRWQVYQTHFKHYFSTPRSRKPPEKIDRGIRQYLMAKLKMPP